MVGKTAAHPVAAEPVCVAGDFFQQRGRQVFSSKQQTQMILFKCRVLQQTKQNCLANLVEQNKDLLGRSSSRPVAVDFEFVLHR